MTHYSDRDIVAFVDGQMDEDARAAFDDERRGDIDLERRVAAHGWMVRQIVAAYGKAPQDAVDRALIDRLGLGAGGIAPMRRAGIAIRPAWARWVAGLTALAASLAVGFLGGRLTGNTEPRLLVQGDGGIIAKGELARALSDQLSGDRGQIQIGLTFKTADGVCRTFKSSLGLSGIGCRDGQQWNLPILVRSNSDQPNGMDYQLASGDISFAVMAEVDRRIVGEPLDEVQEREFLMRR